MHFRVSQSSNSDSLGLGAGSNHDILRPPRVEDCIGKMPSQSNLQEDLLVVAKTRLSQDKGADRSSTFGGMIGGAPANSPLIDALRKTGPSSTISEVPTVGQGALGHSKVNYLSLSKQADSSKLSLPNRVSFTKEDRRPLLNSPSPSLASSSDEAEAYQLPAAVRKDPNKKDKSSGAPLEVAEILRQMSKASVPGKVLPRRVSTEVESIGEHGEASPSTQEMQEQEKAEEDPTSAVAALAAIGKRKLPPSSQKVSTASLPNPNKRIRWQTPTTHSFAPFLAAAANRMVPGMAAAAAAAGLPYNLLLQQEQQQRCLSLIQMIPPARVIPGLNPYDVLFYRQMISHFHIGNRRLLVLASNYLDKYFSGKPKVRETIIDSIRKAHKAAGGRFLVFNERSASFDECPEATTKAILAIVLRRLEQAIQVMGKNLVNVFRAEGCFIWAPPPTAAASRPGGFLPGSEKLTKPQLPSVPRPPVVTNPKVGKTGQSRKAETSSGWTARSSSGKKVIDPMTPLAPDFQPGPFDVICSRGSAARKHPGNVYFVGLIAANCDRYVKSDCKLAKSMIVTDMLDTIRRASPQGGFVKLNNFGRWCETGDHLAREKIGQCFRDRLHTMYSSSSKAKLQKRRQKGLMPQSCDSTNVDVSFTTPNSNKVDGTASTTQSFAAKVAPAAPAVPDKD